MAWQTYHLDLCVISGAVRPQDYRHLAARLSSRLRISPWGPSVTDTPEWFRRQVRSAREGVNHRWVLLGSGLGADRIARGYYEFFGVVPPEAVILLAPSVSALYLNQITCPMLVLHSEEAWLSDFRMRSRMLDAIRHHQARYGDRSEHRVLESVPIGLEDEVLDPRIEDVITDWLVAELSDRRRVRPRAA